MAKALPHIKKVLAKTNPTNSGRNNQPVPTNRTGKPMGSKTLITDTIRGAYYDVLQRAIEGDKFNEWLNAIEDPARKLELAMKMTDYFLPKKWLFEREAEENSTAVTIRVQRLAAKYSDLPTIRVIDQKEDDDE